MSALRAAILDEAGAWLRRRRRSTVVALVAASIAIRVAYFVQLAAGPCIWEQRAGQFDMELFDRWARQITAGDWLLREPLHAYHSWHAKIAASYFDQNPRDVLAPRFAAARAVEERDAVGRELWSRWYGGTRFHQEPLYPYLIAMTYAALGDDVRWVFAWQMVGGVASNLLLYLLARRHMGDLVAVVAATLAVGCSPIVYYELILLRTALVVFTTLAIAMVASIALERRSARMWLCTGVVLGLGVLLQSLFALMVVAVFGILIADRRDDRKTLLRSAAAAAGGIAIVLAPLVARNLAVGAPPFGLSSVGAVTFVCANAADVQPDKGFFLSGHASAVMGRSEGRFLPAILATLRTHPGLGSLARLAWGKFAALGHWYEIPNNTNYYLFRQHAGVLRLLPVTFFLAGPLGFLGLLLALAQLRRFALLYLIVVASGAPMLIFYVLSRFRAPFLMALLPFAAYALVTLVRWALARRWLAAGLALAVGLALGAWMGRPLPPDRPLIRIQDHSVTFDIHYGRLVSEAEHVADWKRAAAAFADFLRLEPEAIRRMTAAHPPTSPADRSFASRYGRIHLRYADTLEKSGLPADAARERGRGEELSRLGGSGSPP